MSNAKKQARKANCTSNQHQISLAYMMYVDENNDWYLLPLGIASIGGIKETNRVNNVVRGDLPARQARCHQ
ncbi:MAG: hypothetical protein P8L18_08830 [Verrucomicrobiota bacterium]|nr:hypothetical protein [Verrucomicrobiota bacterium]